MPEFKRGDTVRRIAGGESNFPNGATALVIALRNTLGYVRVSADTENDDWLIGETWFIPPDELELVPPAEPARPARKIVQISAAADALYALCDDGTLWCACSQAVHPSEWRREPPIPQPESDA